VLAVLQRLRTLTMGDGVYIFCECLVIHFVVFSGKTKYARAFPLCDVIDYVFPSRDNQSTGFFTCFNLNDQNNNDQKKKDPSNERTAHLICMVIEHEIIHELYLIVGLYIYMYTH
jgi:hypothetical protein